MESELRIKVTPNAAKNEVFRRNGEIRVMVTTAPEKGNANEAVLKLLAKVIGCPVSSMNITRGQTSPQKTVLISGLSIDSLNEILEKTTPDRTK